MQNAYEDPEAPAAADLDVQAAFVKQRPLYINVLDDLGSATALWSTMTACCCSAWRARL